jgi:hypothetical protein
MWILRVLILTGASTLPKLLSRRKIGHYLLLIMRYQYSILNPITEGILSLAPFEDKTVGWFSPGNLGDNLHMLAHYRDFLHRSVRAVHLWMICCLLLQAFAQLVPCWFLEEHRDPNPTFVCCPMSAPDGVRVVVHWSSLLNRVFQMATDCILVDFPASSQPYRLVHLDGATMPSHGALHM